MTHIATSITVALLLTAAAAAADTLHPATTDGPQTVLASITGGNPADLIYRP
jgi:hypothetical protein